MRNVKEGEGPMMMVMRGKEKGEKEDYDVLKESDGGGEDDDEGGSDVDEERERYVDGDKRSEAEKRVK